MHVNRKNALNIVLKAGDAVRGDQLDAAINFGEASTTDTTAFWENLLLVGGSVNDSPTTTDTTLVNVVPRQLTTTGTPGTIPMRWGFDLRGATLQNPGGFAASRGFGVGYDGALGAASLTTASVLQAQTATVTSVTVDDPGVFTGNTFPTYALTAPPSGGTTATATVTNVQVVANMGYGSTGKSYTINDVLTFTPTAGGVFTATVSSVDANGGITEISITTTGSVTNAAANPMHPTGGTGTGASFKVYYSQATNIFTPTNLVYAATGSGNTVSDTLTLTGDTGTAGQFTVATVDSFGGITGLTVAVAGNLTVLSASTYHAYTSTNGTATIGSLLVGYGNLTCSVTAGSGYLVSSPPAIWQNNGTYKAAKMRAVMTPASATLSLNPSGGTISLGASASVDGSGNITGAVGTLHGVNQTGSYNVSGVNSAANSWLFATPFYYGASSDSSYNQNYIGISDQVNVYGGNAANGFRVFLSYGGANSAGGRNALYGNFNLNSQTNPGDTNGDYAGIHGWANAAVNNGGTPGTIAIDGTGHRHGLFGGWFQATLGGTATGYTGLSGTEIDVSMAAGAEATLRTGLNIVLSQGDAKRGSYSDVGLSFGKQPGGSSPGWATLIGAGGATGDPATATDTVGFMAQPRLYGGTAYNLVPLGLFADLRQATNTKGVIWSPNFGVTGTGAAYANGVTTNGTVQAQTATMTAVTIDVAGEYTTVPTFTVQAPPAGGTTATVTVATMGGVRALPYATGKAFTNADTLTVSGGTGTAPTLRPTVDANGACTNGGWTVLTNGTLSSAPANPVTLTGGSGTGASVNIVWSNSTGAFVPSVITAATTGSGFAVNDTYSPAGDTGTEPVYKVTAVDASGGILTSTLNSAGSVTAIAAGAHSVTTSGAGTAASITPTFGVLTTSSTAGAGYLPVPPPKIVPANANSTLYTVASLTATMTPASATLSLNPSGGSVTLGPVYTVATLPTVGTKGQRAFVSDANATTFQTIVAGGGANNVPVFDDGTNWRIG